MRSSPFSTLSILAIAIICLAHTESAFAKSCSIDLTSHRSVFQSEPNLLSSGDDLISAPLSIPRGGGWIPAGWNPFGYKVTELGETFLQFDGSLDSDLGRFLASLRERKTKATIKGQWVEVVRVSKNKQTMRIYRQLDDLIKFLLDAGLIN